LSNTIVTTRYGQIEGVIENGIWVFKSVPYAAPPVGELRWKPPQPPAGWSGIRQTRNFGLTSLQSVPPVNVIPVNNEPEESGEDCLFLNIWTPAPDNQKRPVMVWIHGGAFIMGSGSQTDFRGGNLARYGDVVMVSLNYRLGLLGFLNLEAATEGKIQSSGNEGLLDQIFALRWVKENIAAFGGDPDNVTIFGESAGSMSIACLMAMPAAQGLFHKAIMESGAGNVALSLTAATKVAGAFLKMAGWDGDVDKLKALPPAELLRIQTELTLRSPDGITPVAPVVDGKTLPPPLEAIQRGSAQGVKTLTGSNLDEWKLFEMMAPPGPEMTEEMLAMGLCRIFDPTKVAALIAAYRQALTKRGIAVKPADIMSAINTDKMFRMPVVRFIEARRSHSEDDYAYLFTWQSPALNGILKACHALEIGFVFGNPESAFCGSGPDVDKLSDEIQQAWFTFARTGNPGTNRLGEWPPYGEKRQTMLLGKISHMEDDPYSDERMIWDEVGLM
jgi:para-nitrobenzyl esterase